MIIARHGPVEYLSMILLKFLSIQKERKFFSPPFFQSGLKLAFSRSPIYKVQWALRKLRRNVVNQPPPFLLPGAAAMEEEGHCIPPMYIFIYVYVYIPLSVLFIPSTFALLFHFFNGGNVALLNY